MHHIFYIVSYDCLTHIARQFAFSFSSIYVPKSHHEVLMHLAENQAMDEMNALISRWAWDLVVASPGLDVVDSSWVFIVE